MKRTWHILLTAELVKPGHPPQGRGRAKSGVGHQTCSLTLKVLPSVRSVKTLRVYNATPAPRSVSAPVKGQGEERDYLREVQEVLARFNPKTVSREMEGWGGWWRNRYREDQDKARRVLAEVASMVAEHRIHTGPGQTAYDLWGRLP